MKAERAEKKRLKNIALVFDKFQKNKITAGQLLDKNQSFNFFEKVKSYSCEDKASLQTDNGDNQYRYKDNLSCVEMSSSITSKKSRSSSYN